jgi:D-amino peptidase
MKVYISADIEGVTGVTHWDETELSKSDSSLFREQMTAEVAAACEGALQAGATEIWVKDAHDSARNINASKLPREAKLIRGWSGHPFMMLQELDNSFQGALLIGYHSRASMGTSPLAHTMNLMVTRMTINERPASEFLISAYTAGSVKVPVVFVSGDKGLCDEISTFNSNIGTVAVKEGIGNSTVSLHPEVAINKIREGAANALKADLALTQVKMPARFSVEIQYRRAYDAYQKGFFPGATQINDTTIQFENESYFEVMRFLLFVL